MGGPGAAPPWRCASHYGGRRRAGPSAARPMSAAVWSGRAAHRVREPPTPDARALPDIGVRRAPVQADGGGDVGSGPDALGVGRERGDDVLLVLVSPADGGGQQPQLAI